MMKSRPKFILLVFLLVLTTLALFGQQDSSIAVDYRQVLFRDVISQMEKTSGIKIYYDTKALDSILVTYTSGPQKWRVVLKEILDVLKLDFYDNRQQLFIFSSASPVQWKLPDDYFKNEVVRKNDISPKATLQPQKNAFADQVENRVIEIGDATKRSSGAGFSLAG